MLFDMVENRTGPVVTPQAKGVDVSINWLAFPRLHVRHQRRLRLFDIYASGSHKLEGRLILTPSGLKGQGTHDWPQATVSSTLINYAPFGASGDTLYLAIKTADGTGVALEAENLRGNLDFDNKQGQLYRQQ